LPRDIPFIINCQDIGERQFSGGMMSVLEVWVCICRSKELIPTRW